MRGEEICFAGYGVGDGRGLTGARDGASENTALTIRVQAATILAVSRILSIMIALGLLLVPAGARAQGVVNAGGTSAAETSAAGPLRVYLVTFGPGSDPWEKFGHDAVVIEDTDSSIAYNWGVFDFGQGFSGLLTFGWHFLQGRLLYSMQSEDTEQMLDGYVAAGRSILVQELRLTQPQKLLLRDHLRANDTEANRYYLYDYFRKNCTTMARDAIDDVVGGRIAATLKTIPAGTTLRWQDRRTTADELWLYIFLDFQLGHPVDRALSAQEECFLPGVLARRIASVQVPNSKGKLASIVISEKLLNAGIFKERSQPPASFFYGFLAFGIGGAALLALLAAAGLRVRIFRWIFALTVMGWSLLAGLFGALDTFAWFTNHEAAKWNENWFAGNPLSLLLIVAAPMAYRWPRAARRVAMVVLGLSVFGLLAKVTPWFFQVNGSIIAATLPVHAGIALGIYWLTQKRLKPPVPSPASETAHAT